MKEDGGKRRRQRWHLAVNALLASSACVFRSSGAHRSFMVAAR